jgi:hypothetical protein
MLSYFSVSTRGYLSITINQRMSAGKHRDLQRITVPYAKMLDIVGEIPDDEDEMAL